MFVSLPKELLQSVAIVEEDVARAAILQLLIWQEREVRARIYLVTDEASAEKTLNSLRDEVPDVLFINEELGQTDVFQFAAKVTRDLDTEHTWVFMIGEFQNLLDKQRATRQIGAEWFLTRPYNVAEVEREIDHGLRRIDQILIDKTTYLPGNKKLEIIEKRVHASQVPVAFVSGDINDFGQLNYLSEKTGDEALRKYGGIAKAVCREHGAFVAQLSGSDNIGILCSPEDAVSICQEISRRFDHVLPSLYGTEIYQSGYLEIAGEKHRFVTVSWGISANRWYEGDLSFSVRDEGVSLRVTERERKLYFWWQLHFLANEARKQAKLKGKAEGVGWIEVSAVEPFETLTPREQEELKRLWQSS